MLVSKLLVILVYGLTMNMDVISFSLSSHLMSQVLAEEMRWSGRPAIGSQKTVCYKCRLLLHSYWTKYNVPRNYKA